MKFGIDRLLSEPELRAALRGRRVALLGHPASVTADLTHSLDALMACDDLNVTAAFGPQHGMRGDLQDNMMESPDFTDPRHGIPVFSLYGEARRPGGQAMGTFLGVPSVEGLVEAARKESQPCCPGGRCGPDGCK